METELETRFGKARWAALHDPAHFPRIKAFLDALITESALRQMTLGGVTYLVNDVVRPNDDRRRVSGSTMVVRATQMNACRDRAAREYLLDHQSEIPTGLLRSVFVFTEDRDPRNPNRICCVRYSSRRWRAAYCHINGGSKGYWYCRHKLICLA